MKNGKLQIGIVGCGGIANGKHLPSLSKFGELCEIISFCDLIPERAEKAAKHYGTNHATVLTDYKKLLNDDNIDVIHVLTPNVSHAQITVDALDAGKHVLCEKPMSHTASDALKMMDAAKRSNKKFTIGYQNRFKSAIWTLHEACSRGALGDIYFAKAHAVRRRAVPTWGAFLDKSKQGGGPLIDIGTHALDITLWMMNNYKPKSVTGSVFYKMADKYEGNAMGAWDPNTFEVEDSAFGFIKMENGATIFLESSWVLNTTDENEAATTLCGTEAGAVIKSGRADRNPQLILNTAKYGKLFEERISGESGIFSNAGNATDPGDLEARQWLLAIINDTQPLVKPEEAYVVTQILDAIYTSHLTGKTIEF
jgi:predicted dehydrogenase